MKNKSRVTIVLAILFVVYTILTFALPFAKNAVLWMSYLFGVVAIAAQLYVLPTAFAQAKSAKSKFYGFPIARIGIIYLIVQLALGLIFMAAAKLVPLWLPVCLYVVLLGAAAVGFLAVDAVHDEVKRQDRTQKADTTAMRTLQARVSALAAHWETVETQMLLQKMADALRYSDPVSSDATRTTEKELAVCVEALEHATSDAAVKDCLRRMDATLTLRNHLCRQNKG